MARRPDTAYEEDSLELDDSAAMQRLQCRGDEVDSIASLDAAETQESGMPASCTSRSGTSAATLQLQQSQPRGRTDKMVYEPAPPVRGKQRVKASPKIRVLAAKAWT